MESPLMEAIRPRIEVLCSDIHSFLAAVGDDPAFAEVVVKLKGADRQLDVLCASPGHRAALRLQPALSSGQERKEIVKGG